MPHLFLRPVVVVLQRLAVSDVVEISVQVRHHAGFAAHHDRKVLDPAIPPVGMPQAILLLKGAAPLGKQDLHLIGHAVHVVGMHQLPV